MIVSSRPKGAVGAPGAEFLGTGPMAAAIRATVSGWTGCGFFQNARKALQGVSVLTPSLSVEVVEHPTRDAYREWWFAHRVPFGARAQAHNSSPAVWLGEKDVRVARDTSPFSPSPPPARARAQPHPRAAHPPAPAA